MRTIVLMLCMALLGGTINTAMAQDKSKKEGTPEEVATKRTAKLTETLALDANQQKQVYNLILEHGKKKDELKNAKLTEDERHKAKKELHTSFDAQLKTILNADQYKKYTVQKEEMKKEKHGEHKGHDHTKQGGK